MPEPRPRSSALAHLAAALDATPDAALDAGLRLREVAHTAKINVRGNPEDARLTGAVRERLGVALPIEPCTTALGPGLAGQEVTALWLGPNEWLLTACRGAERAMVERLAEALAGTAAAVVDVTDSRTVIGVAGLCARKALAKGCSLDFHASAFRAGEVKRSVLADVDVTVHLLAGGGGGAAFEVYVLRSFAEFLWRWLLDAGAEYGVAVDG